MIKAFWLEEEDENGEDASGYAWVCPECDERNLMTDDFDWDGAKGKFCTREEYFCEHCGSEKGHIITKD